MLLFLPKKTLFFLILISFFAHCSLYSNSNFVSGSLFKSARNPQRVEIDKIVFKGNKFFEDRDFYAFLNTKQSNRSTPHSILEYYYNNIRLIENVPKNIPSTLNNFISNLENEIGYFNSNIVSNDSTALWHLYNIHGFHFNEIYYTFLPDSSSRENVLTFHITEGERYRIDTIAYLGLDSLPADINRKINNRKVIKPGRNFYEPDIITEVNRIQNFLVNNGYFYSKYSIKAVTIDTLIKRDSITVVFNPGIRQKIGNITFIDSTKGQRVLAGGMKRRQVEINENDWYSRKLIKRSKGNLNSLGMFELAIIDTTSEFYPQNDSTLNLKVLLVYRKQIEWDTGMFLNQTPLYNYVNFGFSGSIFHRNLFNAAQSANLYANASINDISKVFSDFNNLESEGQIGLQYSQPLLWTLDNSKISLNSSFTFSARVINKFRLNTWAFPIKFPVKLPNITYFNQLVFDLTFERQEPVNLPDLLTNIEELNQTEYESVLRASILYQDLYNYLNEPKTNLLTSNLMGITLIGDNKDHPFSPTEGSYTYISLDGWNVFLSHPSVSGLSKYFRFQFARSDFFSPNDLAVHAFKVKFGGIYLIDKENSYVPIERQFFAGGANSVRGWQSRKLHYTDALPQKGDTVYTEDDYDLLSNIIGSGGLLEFSYEFRFSFDKINWLSSSVAEQISNFGITFFIDGGNAFHWFAEDVTEVKITDYFTKLAWATGAGLRYETPIGPIRVDFALPLYGPVIDRPDNILYRANILRDTQVHIGIGHAF